MKRKIILTIWIIVLGALAGGYFLWNKPHRNVKDANAIPVKAEMLYTAFTKDSTAAKTTYVNNILAVSGTISSISLNQQKQQLIFLQSGTPDASINCTMEEADTTLKAGSTITIKAICSGYIAGDTSMGLPGDVYLVRGYRIQ